MKILSKLRDYLKLAIKEDGKINEFIETIIYIIKSEDIFHLLGLSILLSTLFLLGLLLIIFISMILFAFPWYVSPWFGIFMNIVFLVQMISIIYIKYFIKDKEK